MEIAGKTLIQNPTAGRWKEQKLFQSRTFLFPTPLPTPPIYYQLSSLSSVRFYCYVFSIFLALQNEIITASQST